MIRAAVFLALGFALAYVAWLLRPRVSWERPESLDAAWAAVEAALPDGWLLVVKDWSRDGDPDMFGGDDERRDLGIEAFAFPWNDRERATVAAADTPAAALRTLAWKLALERPRTIRNSPSWTRDSSAGFGESGW